MGSEGAFAIELQKSLERIFELHESAIRGLSKANRKMLASIKMLKSNNGILQKQNEQLYREVQRLENEKSLLEELRRYGKD